MFVRIAFIIKGLVQQMSIKNRADLKKIKKFLKNFKTIDQSAAYSLTEYRYLAEARLTEIVYQSKRRFVKVRFSALFHKAAFGGDLR